MSGHPPDPTHGITLHTKPRYTTTPTTKDPGTDADVFIGVIVLSSLVAVAAVIGIICFCCRYKKRKADDFKELHRLSVKRQRQAQEQHQNVSNDRSEEGAVGGAKEGLKVALTPEGKNNAKLRKNNLANQSRLTGKTRNSVNNHYLMVEKPDLESSMSNISEYDSIKDPDEVYSELDDDNTYDGLYNVLPNDLTNPSPPIPQPESEYHHIIKPVGKILPIIQPGTLPVTNDFDTTADIEHKDEGEGGGYAHINRETGKVNTVIELAPSDDDNKIDLCAIDLDDKVTEEDNPYEAAIDVNVADRLAMADMENPYEEAAEVNRMAWAAPQRLGSTTSEGSKSTDSSENAFYENELSHGKTTIHENLGSVRGTDISTAAVSSQSKESESYENVGKSIDDFVQLPNKTIIASNPLYEKAPIKKTFSSQSNRNQSYENVGKSDDDVAQLANGTIIAENCFYEKSPVKKTFSSHSKGNQSYENVGKSDDDVVQLANGTIIAENCLYEKAPVKKTFSSQSNRNQSYENVGKSVDGVVQLANGTIIAENCLYEKSPEKETFLSKSNQDQCSEDIGREDDGVVQLANGTMFAENSLYDTAPAHKGVNSVSKQNSDCKSRTGDQNLAMGYNPTLLVESETQRERSETEKVSQDLHFHKTNSELLPSGKIVRKSSTLA